MTTRLDGRRVPNETPPSAYRAGDFGRYQGDWWARPPMGEPRVVAPVSVHQDQTISASITQWILARGDWSLRP